MSVVPLSPIARRRERETRVRKETQARRALAGRPDRPARRVGRGLLDQRETQAPQVHRVRKERAASRVSRGRAVQPVRKEIQVPAVRRVLRGRAESAVSRVDKAPQARKENRAPTNRHDKRHALLAGHPRRSTSKVNALILCNDLGPTDHRAQMVRICAKNVASQREQGTVPVAPISIEGTAITVRPASTDSMIVALCSGAAAVRGSLIRQVLTDVRAPCSGGHISPVPLVLHAHAFRSQLAPTPLMH
jgi:hypothetical protein